MKPINDVKTASGKMGQKHWITSAWAGTMAVARSAKATMLPVGREERMLAASTRATGDSNLPAQ